MDKLPGYCIGEKIGEGAFGMVYKGQILETHEKIAIKIVNFRADKLIRELFTNEVNVLEAVKKCPYVIRIIDAGTSPKGLSGSASRGGFIITKLYNGGTLYESIKKKCEAPRPGEIIGKCPEDLVLDVGLQISTALECIHASGYIHCDIKTDNILIEVDNVTGALRYHLADFGSTIPVNYKYDEEVRGAPAYVQPEIKNTTKKDIWALGAVMYQMTYGRLPHLNVIPFGWFYDRRAFKPIVFDPPCRYTKLLQGMLEETPLKRWTATQVIEEIKALKMMK